MIEKLLALPLCPIRFIGCLIRIIRLLSWRDTYLPPHTFDMVHSENGSSRVHLKEAKSIDNLVSATTDVLLESVAASAHVELASDLVVLYEQPKFSSLFTMSQSHLATQITTLGHTLKEQSTSVQELVAYSIVMLLVEYNQAEITDWHEANGQQWLTIHTVPGEIYKIAKPVATEKILETLSTLARQVLASHTNK